MRNLILKRRKSLTGCLMTAQVYIQDPESDDMPIRGYSCRRLGEIKNGEEKTFEIPNDEARIFVIYDYFSKEFCVDMKKIPAGDEDVRVSGACKFSITKGNPFRFDGDADEEVVAVRTGGSRKGKITTGMAAIIGVFLGLAFFVTIFIIGTVKTNTPKVFSFDGVEITLSGEFKERENPNFVGVASSSGVAVYIERDRFDEVDYYERFKDLTVEEYAALVAGINEIDKTPETKNGIVWVENETVNRSNGKELVEYLAFYKTDDSFWIVEFDVLKTKTGLYGDDVLKWAQSVRFE